MRILVIDDDPGLLRLYPRALRGHDVVAVGPDAAIELVEKDTRFDVVICDLNLPRQGGQWFHDRLIDRARVLEGRVVFCTGGGYDAEGWEILESAPERVVLKPFDNQHLRAVVARLQPLIP